MSGDTVTSKALQFTNDNKHAYAFNSAPSSTTPSILFKFTTNSEYHVGIIQANMGLTIDAAADSATYLKIKFNNEIVSMLVAGLTGTDSQTTAKQNIIIPPHTDVEIEIYSNGDNATRIQTVSYAGKVGMAQRVGNLDE